MTAPRAVLILALLAACALGKRAASSHAPADDAAEEDFKKARELRHVMICKGCEDVVDAAEAKMNEDWLRGKSDQQKAIAVIEFLEAFCGTKEQQQNRINCENGVEHLDKKDGLTKYLKKGVVEKGYKDKKCKKLCTWKSDMKDQISGMQQNMIDRIKAEKEGELQEELAKLRREAREQEAQRRAALTYSEAFLEDLEVALADVADNWVMVLCLSVLFVFIMTFIQVCWGVRKEMRKRAKEIEKRRAQQAGKKVQ